MAVKELGMVYGSQLANEAVNYVTDKYPQGYAGAKYVDLALGVLGAASAMEIIPPVGGENMATAVQIVGLGRLAKATMDVARGISTPGVRMARPMAVRPSVRITGPTAGVSAAGFSPAGV